MQEDARRIRATLDVGDLIPAVANARIRGAIAQLAREAGCRVLWPTFTFAEVNDQFVGEADAAA